MKPRCSKCGAELLSEHSQCANCQLEPVSTPTSSSGTDANEAQQDSSPIETQLNSNQADETHEIESSESQSHESQSEPALADPTGEQITGPEPNLTSSEAELDPESAEPAQAELRVVTSESVEAELVEDESDLPPVAENSSDIHRGSPFAESNDEQVGSDATNVDEVLDAESADESQTAVATIIPTYENRAAKGGSVGAVVLGIMAILGSFLTPASIITAFLGVGMGIWGLFSSHKRSAIVGMSLCAVAIVMCFIMATQ